MTQDGDLSITYKQRYSTVLLPLAARLEEHIKGVFKDKTRIDRIVVRGKSPKSFLVKANKLEYGKVRYTDPLNQIQDQIGARIITFYISDIEPIAQQVLDYFAPIEVQDIVPELPNEFGYEGKHFIFFVPKDILTPDIPKGQCPTFFELQIKTLFQHAWAQADHDLAYKPIEELTWEQKRKVAFTAAQAWGADIIFNKLAIELAKPDVA